MSGQKNAPVNPFERGRELLAGISRPEVSPKADIVFVVSATVSMQPFWDHLLDSAGDIRRIMAAQIPGGRLNPADARLRLIAFKDMYMFWQPFLCSPFYCLPQDEAAMRAFIRGTEPKSRGQERSSGLEAFLLAMYSDWRRENDAVKHIIVLVTDCPPQSLRDPLRAFDLRYEQVLNQHISHHDLALPRTEEELRLCWLNGVGTMDNWNNFLFVYGPDCMEWQALSTWDEISLRLMPGDQIPTLSLHTIFADLRGVL